MEGLMKSAIGTDQARSDLKDEVFEHYLIYYPPTRRSRFIEHCNLVMNRGPIEPEVAAAIVAPTLMIHGSDNLSDPIEYAHAQARELVNVPGGAQVAEVKGGRGQMNIIPTCASIMNNMFAQFLSRHGGEKASDMNFQLGHGHAAAAGQINARHPDIVTPLYTESVMERMARGLRTQARLANDPTIAQRDPRSPLSFSRVPPELEYQQMESIYLFAKGQADAFTPLGPRGMPLRKWSQRTKTDPVGPSGNSRPSTAAGASNSSPSSSSLSSDSSGRSKDRPKNNDGGSGSKLKHHNSAMDEYVDSARTPRHSPRRRPTSMASLSDSDTSTQGGRADSPLPQEFPALYGPQGQQLVDEVTQQLTRVVRITDPEPHNDVKIETVPAGVVKITATEKSAKVAKRVVKNTVRRIL